MLATGRALMSRPTVLLLDEPTNGLAPLIVQELARTLKRLNEAGQTILLVEQNVRVALSIADYVYVIRTGEIVLELDAGKIDDADEMFSAYLGEDEGAIVAMNTSTTPAMEPAPSSFAGRVALVTGGAGAIGRATARALAARGATVIAADIDGFETSRDASDAFSEVRLDVTSKSDVTAVVARAVAAHGGIDLLVNVAGVISHGTARDLAEAEWVSRARHQPQRHVPAPARR